MGTSFVISDLHFDKSIQFNYIKSYTLTSDIIMKVPYESENWSVKEWAIFNKCYPDFKDIDGVSFDGDEYCEETCMWSGVDRRCECGNRRVYWCFDGEWVYPSVY